jgi:hypothetical protein
MKKKKRVLIIMRGIKPLQFENNLFNKTRDFLFGKSNPNIGIPKEHYDDIALFLNKDYDVVEQVKWDGSVFNNPTLSVPINALKNLLGKHKHSDVDILAVSLGGHILERAFTKKGANKINKILYIGAVHRGDRKIHGVNKFINVYSLTDKVFLWANDVIEGLGNLALKGENVLNIALNGVGHAELLSNKKIKQKGIKEKQLYELYRNLLISK